MIMRGVCGGDLSLVYFSSVSSTREASAAINVPLDDLESRATGLLPTRPLPTRPCVGRSGDFRGYRAAYA